MRLGEQEYRLAKLLAKDAGCSVNEAVEMAVRLTFMSFALRPNGAEEFGDIVAQARTIKAEMPPPSVPKPRRRPPKSKTLTHNPFAALKDSRKEPLE